MSVDGQLAAWLADALGDPGPFTLTPLTGGNSNETLALESPAARRVLRRPPHSAKIDPKAHSMAREHRVLDALARSATPVPAPRALAYCDDPSVAPGGFLVMEWVDGVSLTESLPAGFAGSATDVGHAVIDALAALHTVDYAAVGLEDFGRPESFLERQVPRWRDQYEGYATRDLRWFAPVAEWLEAHRPGDFSAGIMHGDFHADNTLVSVTAPTQVSAILDFEMTTIGDPLVDLGLLLAFWGDERPADPAMPRVQAFSRGAGAPTRQVLADRYADVSGRSVEHLDFYMAFALWKLGSIVEGAYTHLLRGSLDNRYARDLERDVPALFAEAAAIAGLTGA